jgi:hypothetical protein
MNRAQIVATLSLGGLLLFAATAAPASTLTCESRNDARQACPVDARNGVRLTRQLSSQGCWQNDTWGFDQSQVWVDRGCRAEFEVGAPAANPANKNNAIAAAAVVGLAAAAVIASNQHDDHHKNNHNKNYDNYNNYNKNNGNRYDDRYDDRYYNNDRGSNYSNSRYGYNGYGGDPRRTFSCESRNDRRTYCDVPGRGHVEVFRQHSSSPCTYGRSWGVNGNSVWVEDGCRAEFAVY